MPVGLFMARYINNKSTYRHRN